jgi:hypothetical protein
MIRAVVDFALNDRFLILLAAVMLLVWGAVSQWPGARCRRGRAAGHHSYRDRVGVSVQTGVIMLEYINQLRVRAIPSRIPLSRAQC